jgi:hypothetical protein
MSNQLVGGVRRSSLTVDRVVLQHCQEVTAVVGLFVKRPN